MCFESGVRHVYALTRLPTFLLQRRIAHICDVGLKLSAPDSHTSNCITFEIWMQMSRCYGSTKHQKLLSANNLMPKFDLIPLTVRFKKKLKRLLCRLEGASHTSDLLIVLELCFRTLSLILIFTKYKL